MIRRLSEGVRGRLRTGVALTSIAQCMEELVLNSVDAGSTCIAVRVDLQTFTITVVDNGVGINREQLTQVGERYCTSKCHTVEDLDNLKYFGYRGEALASLCCASSFVELATRPANCTTTYSKCFHKGRPLAVAEASVPRPGMGTTVIARDLFYNLPVRKKSIQEGLELERIRFRMSGLALMWPLISFSLRDDITGNVILQTHKCSSILSTFTSLFGSVRAKHLKDLEIQDEVFKISGYVSRENYSRKDLQFVFVNKRLVLKSKVHKLLNTVLGKSVLVRKRDRGGTGEKTKQDKSPAESTASPTKLFERCAVYVINIDCPLSTYDITFDPAKTLIEFHDWPKVNRLVETMLMKFLKEENLLLPTEDSKSVESTSNPTVSFADEARPISPDVVSESDDPFNGAEEGFDEEYYTSLQRKQYTQGISTHTTLNTMFSRTVRRPAQPQDDEGFEGMDLSNPKKNRLDNDLAASSGFSLAQFSSSLVTNKAATEIITVPATSQQSPMKQRCSENSTKKSSLRVPYKSQTNPDGNVEMSLPVISQSLVRGHPNAPVPESNQQGRNPSLSQKLRMQVERRAQIQPSPSEIKEICLPPQFAQVSSLGRLRARLSGMMTPSPPTHFDEQDLSDVLVEAAGQQTLTRQVRNKHSSCTNSHAETEDLQSEIMPSPRKRDKMFRAGTTTKQPSQQDETENEDFREISLLPRKQHVSKLWAPAAHTHRHVSQNKAFSCMSDEEIEGQREIVLPSTMKRPPLFRSKSAEDGNGLCHCWDGKLSLEGFSHLPRNVVVKDTGRDFGQLWRQISDDSDMQYSTARRTAYNLDFADGLKCCSASSCHAKPQHSRNYMKHGNHSQDDSTFLSQQSHPLSPVFQMKKPSLSRQKQDEEANFHAKFSVNQCLQGAANHSSEFQMPGTSTAVCSSRALRLMQENNVVQPELEWNRTRGAETSQQKHRDSDSLYSRNQEIGSVSRQAHSTDQPTSRAESLTHASKLAKFVRRVNPRCSQYTASRNVSTLAHIETSASESVASTSAQLFHPESANNLQADRRQKNSDFDREGSCHLVGPGIKSLGSLSYPPMQSKQQLNAVQPFGNSASDISEKRAAFSNDEAERQNEVPYLRLFETPNTTVGTSMRPEQGSINSECDLELGLQGFGNAAMLGNHDSSRSVKSKLPSFGPFETPQSSVDWPIEPIAHYSRDTLELQTGMLQNCVKSKVGRTAVFTETRTFGNDDNLENKQQQNSQGFQVPLTVSLNDRRSQREQETFDRKHYLSFIPQDSESHQMQKCPVSNPESQGFATACTQDFRPCLSEEGTMSFDVVSKMSSPVTQTDTPKSFSSTGFSPALVDPFLAGSQTENTLTSCIENNEAKDAMDAILEKSTVVGQSEELDDTVQTSAKVRKIDCIAHVSQIPESMGNSTQNQNGNFSETFIKSSIKQRGNVVLSPALCEPQQSSNGDVLVSNTAVEQPCALRSPEKSSASVVCVPDSQNTDEASNSRRQHFSTPSSRVPMFSETMPQADDSQHGLDSLNRSTAADINMDTWVAEDKQENLEDSSLGQGQLDDISLTDSSEIPCAQRNFRSNLTESSLTDSNELKTNIEGNVQDNLENVYAADSCEIPCGQAHYRSAGVNSVRASFSSDVCNWETASSSSTSELEPRSQLSRTHSHMNKIAVSKKQPPANQPEPKMYSSAKVVEAVLEVNSNLPQPHNYEAENFTEGNVSCKVQRTEEDSNLNSEQSSESPSISHRPQPKYKRKIVVDQTYNLSFLGEKRPKILTRLGIYPESSSSGKKASPTSTTVANSETEEKLQSGSKDKITGKAVTAYLRAPEESVHTVTENDHNEVEVDKSPLPSQHLCSIIPVPLRKKDYLATEHVSGNRKIASSSQQGVKNVSQLSGGFSDSIPDSALASAALVEDSHISNYSDKTRQKILHQEPYLPQDFLTDSEIVKMAYQECSQPFTTHGEVGGIDHHLHTNEQQEQATTSDSLPESVLANTNDVPDRHSVTDKPRTNASYFAHDSEPNRFAAKDTGIISTEGEHEVSVSDSATSNYRAPLCQTVASARDISCYNAVHRHSKPFTQTPPHSAGSCDDPAPSVSNKQVPNPSSALYVAGKPSSTIQGTLNESDVFTQNAYNLGPVSPGEPTSSDPYSTSLEPQTTNKPSKSSAEVSQSSRLIGGLLSKASALSSAAQFAGMQSSLVEEMGAASNNKEKKDTDTLASPTEAVWVPVTDPSTGGMVYMNSLSGHTLTQAQWNEKEKELSKQGFRKTTVARTPSPKNSTGEELSPLSHRTLQALLKEHFEEEEEAQSKWREGSRRTEDDDRATVKDILATWENPVFRFPEQILQMTSWSQAGSKVARCFFEPTTFTKQMLAGAKDLAAWRQKLINLHHPRSDITVIIHQARSNVIGQLDNKFLACLIQEGGTVGGAPSTSIDDAEDLVVLFDQHAAHERVRLEQLTANVYEHDSSPKSSSKGKRRIQRSDVQPPRTVLLSEEDVRLMINFRDEYDRIGVTFEADKQHRDIVHVHTIPSCMALREANDRKRGKDPLSYEYLEIMIREHNQLMKATAGARQQLPQQVHRLLATHACKGAIKFGDKLSVETSQELLSSLASCDLPFQCAHGRPSLAPILSLRQLKQASAEKRSAPKLWKLRERMSTAALDEDQ